MSQNLTRLGSLGAEKAPPGAPRALALIWTDCSWSIEISAHLAGASTQHSSNQLSIDMKRQDAMMNHIGNRSLNASKP
jgi:hypothetical protein